jgi:hypothetical protein
MGGMAWRWVFWWFWTGGGGPFMNWGFGIKESFWSSKDLLIWSNKLRKWACDVWWSMLPWMFFIVYLMVWLKWYDAYDTLIS